MKLSMTNTSDVNCQNEDDGGATLLWNAAEKGHDKALHEILRHPAIDPNKVRRPTQTTPLHIAADRGHESAVKALLLHPKVQINLGKIDTGASPLLAAVEQGREGVVQILLENQANVNQASAEGITPLCAACDRGHEYCVELLLATDGINIKQTTLLSLAASHCHVKIVEMLVAYCRRERPGQFTDFPVRHHFDFDLQYRDAALLWARNIPSSSAPNSTKENDKVSASSRAISAKLFLTRQ
jgi:ankyrin repeat protein